MHRDIRKFPATHKLVDYARRRTFKSAATRASDPREISWMGRAHSGEDQGGEGSCGIQAVASVIEAGQKIVIPMREREAAYAEALRLIGGKPGDGLDYPTCIEAAIFMGWLPAGCTFVPCEMDHIYEAPLLGAYAVNLVIDRASKFGVLDDSEEAIASSVRGYHAMPVLSRGFVGEDPGSRITGEQSWGEDWGALGIWGCYETLHARICYELGYIKGLTVLPI
jgi:hypothetical protein